MTVMTGAWAGWRGLIEQYRERLDVTSTTPVVTLPEGAHQLAATAMDAWNNVSAASTYTVVIDKRKFGPIPVGLRQGDTILWVNRDILRHTATAVDHAFDVDLPAGKAGKTVIERSGTIPFSCRFHPGMKGALQVK